MDLSRASLIEIAFDALAPDGAAPPSRLRASVLAAATAAKSPFPDLAWPETAPGESSAKSAFLQTAAELAELLGTLSDDEWERPTRVPGRRVRDLVVHLVGVERYVLGQLGRTAPVPARRRQDHYPVSIAAASELIGATGANLCRSWWLAVMEVIAACGQLGSHHPAEYHDLPVSVRGLLVVRTFELWTHGDDIRLATDRRADELDEDRLAIMSGELMRVLSLGMALTGTTQPGRTARIELTGEVAGDEALLEPILAGASAFAAD
jgi:uncharacterized protein (TIGR03083 family)